MPVRKIPLNHQSITGVFPSIKSVGSAHFESSLERDFFTILDFDNAVESFEVQPVKIQYLDNSNVSRTYTPDVLVEYRKPKKKGAMVILYEVKYRTDLRTNWPDWKCKFRAAYAYAKRKGWTFKIVTDKEIRRPYLNNAKFLRKYDTPITDPRFETVFSIAIDLRQTTPNALLQALSADFSNQAECMHLIWQMIARRYLMADLTQPLSMDSRIWLYNIDYY